MCLHCLRALKRPSFFQKNSPVFLRFGVPLILSKGWQKAGFFVNIFEEWLHGDVQAVVQSRDNLPHRR